ncbi:MAG TPA: MEDS domain-containing protein [Gemmatimonadaceae bacterium]
MSETHVRLAKTISETACGVGPTRAGLPGHDVQFYRSDAYLTRAVVDFLAAGVRVGQPIIVIATESHRHAFAEGLRRNGLDMDQLFTDRLAVWLDARQTMACFMEGRLPDRELFMATVGSEFEKLLNKRHYLVVRGYGEMVDLLWKDGNRDGAILLEQLWNELADRYKYSLLCGYSVDNFLHEAGVDALRQVCNHHSHALPLEPFDQPAA